MALVEVRIEGGLVPEGSAVGSQIVLVRGDPDADLRGAALRALRGALPPGKRVHELDTLADADAVRADLEAARAAPGVGAVLLDSLEVLPEALRAKVPALWGALAAAGAVAAAARRGGRAGGRKRPRRASSPGPPRCLVVLSTGVELPSWARGRAPRGAWLRVVTASRRSDRRARELDPTMRSEGGDPGVLVDLWNGRLPAVRAEAEVLAAYAARHTPELLARAALCPPPRTPARAAKWGAAQSRDLLRVMDLCAVSDVLARSGGAAEGRELLHRGLAQIARSGMFRSLRPDPGLARGFPVQHLRATPRAAPADAEDRALRGRTVRRLDGDRPTPHSRPRAAARS